mmetsp:Transcript_19513/g.28059  ORF Transcript_19513/g.28059 Transcript_19513/m.28059 type:complete len:1111 (-) Transcript_19513:184-3516(-)|eukprot:CAMPEP_0185033588 /NCGR_PEP_ID=MMETSP1103-20130426/22668_1 /TAXON_ID=36769 /ORGANISM="Paraphysomonas bandaiensis, Strain Caron Lab Isolate" /LENGTH=1110 /DNA_ID=CAMNT_0027569913 /DNA_START=68 /DNA_END=3400 /DNA_ORIENTATION=+
MSELSLPLDSAVPPNDAPVSVLSDEEERSPRTAKLTTIVSGLNQRFSSLNRMLSLSGADDEDEDMQELSELDENKDQPAAGAVESLLAEGIEDDVEDLDALDLQIWEDNDIPRPPIPTSPVPTMTVDNPPSTADAGVDPSELPLENNLLAAIPDYSNTFQTAAEEMSLEVCRVPEELLRARQLEVEGAAAAKRQELLSAAKQRERDLLWREHMARRRVEEQQEIAKNELKQAKQQARLTSLERERTLALQFRRAKEEMSRYLESQGARLREMYGEVSPGQKLNRRYKVEWDMSPLPVEMRIRNLRACKNKLPKGAYVVMLTQYDRLGGRPLMWSKLGAYGIGPDRPATTRPVKHYGRYFDRVMKVEDSVFALCPPKSQLKPSYVFVIELFQLASRTNPMDRVVAWTALPMIDAHFKVVTGKFRLPLMRGEPNPSVEHFKLMERMMADDLNTWMCNIYIDVRHLPRSMDTGDTGAEKSEYDIELDFMSKLLNLGSQHGDKKASDGEEEEEDFRRQSVSVNAVDVDTSLFNRKLHRRRRHKKAGERTVNAVADAPPRESMRRNMLNAKGGGGASGWWTAKQLADDADDRPREPLGRIVSGTSSQSYPGQPALQEESSSSDDNSNDGDEKASDEEQEIFERGYDDGDGFFLHDHQKGNLVGLDTLDSEVDRAWAAAGIEGGNTVRRWQADGPRLDSQAISKSRKRGLKRSNTFCGDSWTTPLVDQKDYDEYSVSLAPDPGQQRRLLPSALIKSKLRYLYYEALGELSPSQWGSFESHVTIFAFILAFWMRMYVHYIGQYFFLQAFETPVYSFSVRVYEMVFKYMASSVPVSVEFGLVVMGPLGNVFVLSCLVGLAAFFYRYAGYMPDSASQFVAAYGIATFFDPLMIFLVDVIGHNYSCSEVDNDCKEDYTSRACDCFVGDFMKLWNRMENDENSGITGLIITLMVYTATSVTALLILYEYMIHIHKDARILDIWRRVSAPAEEFFVPHDFEMSYEELRSILSRAETWRGAKGSVRKVTMSEYEEKDPYDLNFTAITKHYAIYEHEMDGKRTLHRHFLMLPDGAIIEIFDQLSLDFSNQFKSLQKLLGDSKTRNDGVGTSKQSLDIFSGLENV